MPHPRAAAERAGARRPAQPPGIRGSKRRRSAACRLVALAAAAGAFSPSETSAQLGTQRWRPDERVLVTDVQSVTVLARDPTRLYAASRGGLVIFDELAGRYEPPLTFEDGYPAAGATAMVFDPRDGTLWLAGDRRLLQLDPFSREFVDDVPLRDVVEDLVPADAASTELFLRSRGEWYRLDTFTRQERPAAARDVREAVDRNRDLRARRDILADAGFQSVAPLLVQRFGARPARITDVMPGRRSSQYWIATDGGFVFEYDHISRTGRALGFGLLGSGTAGVTEGPGGLWFAPREARAGRFGIVRSDTELQHWEMWRADSSLSVPPSGSRALLASGAEVWVGGERGLHVFRENTSEWQSAGEGIPPGAYPILALAAERGAGMGVVWIGTRRGLFRISAPGFPPDVEVLGGRTILALHEGPEALWIGTEAGLLALHRDDAGRVVDVVPARGPNALRARAGALAGSGDTLYAALGSEVWERTGGEWRRVDAVGRVSGAVTALAVRDGVLWAGSAEEVVVWDPEDGFLRRLSFAAGDLPPDPSGLRGVQGIWPLAKRSAWLATAAGALRLDLSF